MRHRTLDEMVSYFNQQVSEMDIDQSYKIQLLGMVSAIAYGVQKPQWIPCSERLPKKERRTYWVCTDAETQHECRWTNNRFGMMESDEWGWNIFDTPQYTKVIAWMPLPEPWRGEQNG